MTYFVTRISLSIIFLYHGIVPKLVCKNSQEILMNDTLMPFIPEDAALLATGIGEVIYGVLLLVFYRSRILMYPSLVFPVVITLALIVKLPSLFENAFNPFSINVSLFALAFLNIKSFPFDAWETGRANDPPARINR